MDITVEELARHVLELRDDDRARLELAGEVEADAFQAFASDYVAILPPCTNCHTP